MSRWIEHFQNHPFQEIWNSIQNIKENLVIDDRTITTSVEELARLNKAITFVDSLLKSCDPELIPISTWDTFKEQSETCLQRMNNYQNNKDINQIHSANKNLDNLLTYIRPYQVISGQAAKSANKSFIEYAKTINKNLNSFQTEANNILSEINDYKNRASHDAEVTKITKGRVKELELSYFNDDNQESLSTKISNFEAELETIYDQIQAYKVKLIDGDSVSASISEEIENAHGVANSDSASISVLLNDVESKLSDFKLYHKVVFGDKNDEGELVGGLRSEMLAREKHLEQFKNKQEVKYTALNDEIESLLPGATSAGLASAYYDLKESFNAPIKNYSKLFYGSISFLILTAFISITQEVGFFYIKFVDVTELTKLFSNFLHKLPLVIPVLWLTMFASKRRSESLRLQQEYAHKEAIAKSYQSFKVQIDALTKPEPELMNKLLSSAIEAVSKNASDTLDKKHDDKTPIHEGLDGLVSNMEKIKKVFE
jgi:hypothetical protein